MGHGSFATALNCMDGRTQSAVTESLKKRFGVEYVDQITEPGIVNILANSANGAPSLDWIRRKCDISVQHHHSKGIAIVAHVECAGNAVSDDEQQAHLKRAVDLVKSWYPNLTTLGLWVEKQNENWFAEPIV